MRKLLLSPRWLAGHVLVAACVVACLWLGRWQWQRAASGGGGQSLGYALQWPLFAAFAVFAWTKVVRMERDRVAGHPTSVPRAGVSDATTAATAGAVSDGWRRESLHGSTGPSSTGPSGIGPSGTGSGAGRPADEEDDELTAYNRYLARLAAEDRYR